MRVPAGVILGSGLRVRGGSHVDLRGAGPHRRRAGRRGRRPGRSGRGGAVRGPFAAPACPAGPGKPGADDRRGHVGGHGRPDGGGVPRRKRAARRGGAAHL